MLSLRHLRSERKSSTRHNVFKSPIMPIALKELGDQSHAVLWADGVPGDDEIRRMNFQAYDKARRSSKGSIIRHS